MQRIFGYVMALTTIAVMSVVAPAQAQPQGIVPGKALGGLSIGQDLDPIIGSLGPLHSEEDLPGGAFRGYYWPLKRIGVIVDIGTKKVAALAVSYDDGYQTEKGVTAGTEMDTVRSAYGKEESVDSHQDDDTLVYNALGVAFVVDKTGALGGRVSVIFVFGQGHYKEIFQEQP
ncbi:MAG TPA: hypothetical protein VJT32_11660 [bacterium]|nr:hypothetical protein [bacterium]